jgi:hypothetical protein
LLYNNNKKIFICPLCCSLIKDKEARPKFHDLMLHPFFAAHNTAAATDGGGDNISVASSGGERMAVERAFLGDYLSRALDEEEEASAASASSTPNAQ